MPWNSTFSKGVREAIEGKSTIKIAVSELLGSRKGNVRKGWPNGNHRVYL